MIVLKKPPEAQLMRDCGRAAAAAMVRMADSLRPGISTAEIDAIGEEVLSEYGAIPSFKGYRGYPAAVCISVNEEVVHGIPSGRMLKEGDIVSLDIGAFKNGFHTDHAWTFPVGEISTEAKRLLSISRESLNQGIAQAKPGRRIGDISHTIQSYVERNGYSVVRDLTGHGIGRDLHEDPSVPNFGKLGTGPSLRAGMTFCIEPMVCVGRHRVNTLDDHWTVVTADGSLSAHFEHTILVTENGPEILTQWDQEGGADA